MPEPLIIIGDVHGCYKTLIALVTKAQARLEGKGKVYLLGDLIDRGPRSAEVLAWAMKERVPTCLGNHEHMMVDHLINQRDFKASEYERGLWRENWGKNTILSFKSYVPAAVIAWMDQLPNYIIPADYPNLLLSHTGHGMRKDISTLDAVWERSEEFPDDGLYRVLGHTVQKEPFVGPKYAKIDTGPAFKDLGRLTALIWPSKEIIQQTNVD